MPKIRRHKLRPKLLDHLAERVRLREVSSDDLIALRDWLDTNPEVPAGDWFKPFANVFLGGRGALVTTILSKQQSPLGEKVS
ncbi:hypothetical protein SBV1_3300002 [Verrucomicrobia bacterium]|nr:hypothetical protein SBV1_3300002 [Verrucomicrobiota bacterium]